MSSGTIKHQDLLTVLFSSVLLLSPLLYVDSLFQPSDLPRYFVMAVAGPLAVGWLAFGGTPLKWGTGTVLALGLFIWAAITITWSSAPEGAYLLWMQWLSAGLCAFAIAQQAHSRTFVWALVTASVVGGALIALIGTLENLGVPSPYRDTMVAGATFYVKNHAALYLDAIAPAAVGAIFFAADRRARWFFGICSGLVTGYLLMSRTRGSWLALVMVAIAAAWACRHFRWPWREAVRTAKGPLLAGLCIALSIAAYPGEIAKIWSRPIQSDAFVDQSTGIRLSLYANTLPIVLEHPFAGVGLNGWPQSFRDHYLAPRQLTVPPDLQEQRTHNDPLQFTVELGIPAGVLILVLLTLPLTRTWSLAKDPDPETTENGLLIAIGFGLLATLVHSFVDFPLHKPSSTLQYAAWSGLILGSGKAAYTLPKPIWRTALIVLALLLSTIAVRDHIRFFKGSELTFSTTELFPPEWLKPMPCTDAVKAADGAVRLFPEYFAAHIQRVKVHAKCSTDDTLIRVMTEELAHNPTDTSALLARGHAWLRQQQFERAESDFRAVVSRFDYDYRAWDALVELYQATGDVVAAHEAAAKAASLDAFRPKAAAANVLVVP